MIYPYYIKQIERNTFHRIFMHAVNIETYMASYKEIVCMTDRSCEVMKIITDYSDCQIIIENSEFIILANFIKNEFDFCKKFKCAAIVSCETNATKLALWKDDYILHGIYILGKICLDKRSAFDFIGVSKN